MFKLCYCRMSCGLHYLYQQPYIEACIHTPSAFGACVHVYQNYAIPPYILHMIWFSFILSLSLSACLSVYRRFTTSTSRFVIVFLFCVCSVRNFARHRGNGSMEVLSFAFKSVMIESFRRRHRYSSFYPFKLRFGYENLPPIYPSNANGFFFGELCNCDLSVCACFCNRHNVSNWNFQWFLWFSMVFVIFQSAAILTLEKKPRNGYRIMSINEITQNELF